MTAAYRIGCAVALLLAVAMARPAVAHPHVFVDAHAEIVFDTAGAATAVRHIWQFDEAFTAFAVQGLDADNDGKLSDDELAPLAKVNIDSLKEYAFFTWLRQGKKSYSFVQPTEYWLEFHGGRLTLFYTLPLKTPVMIRGKATLEVFDPEYFVAFTFPKHQAVTLANAPAGCAAQYQPPRMLDAQTMAMLSAIPVDQHDLPPELQDAAAGLANLIALSCPGEAGGSAVDPFEAVMAGAGGKADDGAAAPPPVPQAAPLPATEGNLTAADIAAAPGGGAAAPATPAAAVADPPIAVAANDQAALPPPATLPAPAVATESAAGESTMGEVVGLLLAVAVAGGIAAAGYLLQRRLRRAR